MRKQKRNSKPVAVYGVTPLKSRLIPLILLPFFLLAAIMSGAGAFLSLLGGVWISVCIIGLFGYGFLSATWLAFQESCGNRLVLFDTGIKVQHLGVKSFAYWDELDQFGWKLCEGKIYWGIRVDKSIIESKSFFSRFFLHANKFDDIIPLNQFEKIPRISDTQIDLERFKKTPLGSDLYYYAPHLFDIAQTNHIPSTEEFFSP